MPRDKHRRYNVKKHHDTATEYAAMQLKIRTLINGCKDNEEAISALTKLNDWCREQKKDPEYIDKETMKNRTFNVKLSNDEFEKLEVLATKFELPIEQILRTFIVDLVDGYENNGEDIVDTINEYFFRCIAKKENPQCYSFNTNSGEHYLDYLPPFDDQFWEFDIDSNEDK